MVEFCRRSSSSEQGLLEQLEEAGELGGPLTFNLKPQLCGHKLEPQGVFVSLCVEAPRVYRFPVFEKSFCEELVEELEHFEQSAAPKGRPNTMNQYGVKYLAGRD